MKYVLAAAVLLFTATQSVAQSDPWKLIYDAVSHPRCANCHTADDRPRWFDAASGQHKIHAMNVQRGRDGMGNTGMRCSTCHQGTNAATPNGPPGAANWHLAPTSMAWFAQSEAQVCAALKDQSKNGNRDIAALAEHVMNDKLVAWGWAPGGNREPAPHSAQQLHDAILAWGQAGSPCPK